jgi:hypothetical protein
LANRLKAHVAATLYAATTGRSLLVRWRRNAACGAQFQDLFEWSGQSRGPFLSLKLLRFPGIHAHVGELLERDHAADLVVLDSRWQWITQQQLWPVAGRRRDEWRPGLQVRGPIESEVHRITDGWPTSVIGMHIRRGDFSQMTGWLVPVEKYVEGLADCLRESPAESKVFVATDATDDEIRPVIDLLGSRLVRTRSSARDTVEGVSGALVDLLCLSRTKRLLLTPRSSFGEMAALIGDVPFAWI